MQYIYTVSFQDSQRQWQALLPRGAVSDFVRCARALNVRYRFCGMLQTLLSTWCVARCGKELLLCQVQIVFCWQTFDIKTVFVFDDGWPAELAVLLHAVRVMYVGFWKCTWWGQVLCCWDDIMTCAAQHHSRFVVWVWCIECYFRRFTLWFSSLKGLYRSHAM